MGGSPGSQDIFDVRKVRRLVELMNEHDLSEMDLKQGDMRIRIRRGGEPVIAAAPRQVVAAPAPAAPLAAPEAPKAPAAKPAEAPADPNVAVVRSPMVGTFYAAPDPDSPPYVKVGDMIGPKTVVCIVEAMKVFNQIEAEVAGKIVAVLVENGQPVEFGQALFKVDTRQ
jgi:acetyl-CoA carboxylase biotin carboxyl carrier protein